MKNITQNLALIFFSLLLFCGCNDKIEKATDNEDVSIRFVEHAPEKSGLVFSNLLDENTLVNPFNYINAYNGGGVAALLELLV